MTSSRSPSTSKSLPSFKEYSGALRATLRDPGKILLLWLFFLLTHAITLGVSDDEAYYWVTAQRPAWGYLFHPPMVSWWIGASEWLLSPLFGKASVFSVRLPAIIGSVAVLGWSLRFARLAGTPFSELGEVALLILSFAGLFGMSWMMVPDVPLVIFFMALFLRTFEGVKDVRPSRMFEMLIFTFLAAGTVLSKFSGVLACASAVGSLLIFGKGRKWEIRGICLGVGIAALVVVGWNAYNDWGALRYQFYERHSDSPVSVLRFLRFWIIELVIAGVGVLVCTFGTLKHLRRSENLVLRYCAFWILPALVFCVQPLVSEFKVHWALIAFFPGALALATDPEWRASRWARFQKRQGWILIVLSVLVLHTPLIGAVALKVVGPERYDPRWDLSNDLVGWDLLPGALEELKARYPDADSIPVLGSRYQTTAQAAFALKDTDRVTWAPRPIAARSEWSETDAVSTPGPDQPVLQKPLWYVSDHRYTAPPDFPNGRCIKISDLKSIRAGIQGRVIGLYRCDP